MKKLKLIKIACVIVITGIYFCSCKKSTQKPQTTTNSVVGYWFSSSGSFNQSFLLRSGGTLKVYDFYQNPTSRDTTIAYDGTGTYSVSGNTITISTSFPNGQTFPNSQATLNFNVSPATFTSADGSVYTKQ